MNGGGGSDRQLDRNFLQALEDFDVEAATAQSLGSRLEWIRSTVDLLELQGARYLAAFERRQACRELGEPSSIEWLRSHTHVSAATAANQVVLARQLEKLEETVAAVEEGEISFEHALQIARQLDEVPQVLVSSAQDELLAAARDSDPRELRRLGTVIRHRFDPTELEERDRAHHRKRRLRLFEHEDGMLGLEGALPAPEGMKLRLCLESLVGIPAKGDERSAEQRQADALVGLCAGAIATRLPRLGGRRPQLTVLVRTELGAEVAAELEGVGPISLGTLERLRGEDHWERRQRVDPGGVTLNFGRARRCHSEAQRLEISTRHPACVVRGCGVPIRDCEIHHPLAWKEGGVTDSRGLPLCRRRHHRQVSEDGFILRCDSEGRYELVRGPT